MIKNFIKTLVISGILLLGNFSCTNQYHPLSDNPISISDSLVHKIGVNWVASSKDSTSQLKSCLYGTIIYDSLVVTHISNLTMICNNSDTTLRGVIFFTPYVPDDIAEKLAPHINALVYRAMIVQLHLNFSGIVYGVSHKMQPKMWGAFSLYRYGVIYEPKIHLTSFN